MSKIACQISGIVKSFGPNKVLREINLDLPAGKITALMGANGAGKSTLVKILCGVHQADAGSVFLFGKSFDPISPADAFKSGVVTVHQSINNGVIPDLDIVSNLMIDRLAEQNSGFFINSEKLKKEANKIASAMDININTATLVRDLGPADKQMIAIARAMSHSPKLLILDEPTSSLSENEAKRLFVLLEKLKKQGVAILYISHRMSDINSIADRIVAMRDGTISGLFEDKPLDYEGAVTAMLGQKLSQAAIKTNKGKRLVLNLEGIKLSESSTPFDLSFYENEIVSITGLIGSGKTNLASEIFGLNNNSKAKMTLNANSYSPNSPKEAIAAGVFMCPKDRASNAIVSEFDISNNLALPFFKRHSKLSFLRNKTLRKNAKNSIDKLGIVCQSEMDSVTTLSGGNQQKVMVGRWLAEESSVLLLDEPFQGVDIKARRDIGLQIRSTSDQRATLIFVAELDEALEIADRVIVLHEGNLVGEFENESKNIPEIVSSFSGRSVNLNSSSYGT
jgi:simple sugar transport system ATP-binding protein